MQHKIVSESGERKSRAKHFLFPTRQQKLFFIIIRIICIILDTTPQDMTLKIEIH